MDFLGWLVTAASTLVGAFLGSYLSALYARRQKERETESRRSQLLQLLREQLQSIGPEQERDPDSLFFGEQIRTGAATALLNGETLSYEHHGALIKALQHFEVACGTYNDFVAVANHTIMFYPSLTDNHYQGLYEQAAERFHKIHVAKGEVCAAMGTFENETPPNALPAAANRLT